MTQAIALKKQIEQQHNFRVQLLSNGIDSYLICIALELVDNSGYLYLEQIALENKLSFVLSQGYCIIIER
jgi:hypothetical protein